MTIPKITLGGRIAIHTIETREIEFFDYFKDIYSDSYLRITYKFVIKVQIRDNDTRYDTYYDVTLHKLQIKTERILNNYMHYTTKVIEMDFINRQVTVNNDVYIFMIDMEKIQQLMINIMKEILNYDQIKRPIKLTIGYLPGYIWIK